MVSQLVNDILGGIGGFVLAFCLAPQIYKMYLTKSADDISFAWTAAYVTGLLFNMVYLILEGAVVGWAFVIVEMSLAISLVSYKIYLDRAQSKPAWMTSAAEHPELNGDSSVRSGLGGSLHGRSGSMHGFKGPSNGSIHGGSVRGGSVRGNSVRGQLSHQGSQHRPDLRKLSGSGHGHDVAAATLLDGHQGSNGHHVVALTETGAHCELAVATPSGIEGLAHVPEHRLPVAPADGGASATNRAVHGAAPSAQQLHNAGSGGLAHAGAFGGSIGLAPSSMHGLSGMHRVVDEDLHHADAGHCAPQMGSSGDSGVEIQHRRRSASQPQLSVVGDSTLRAPKGMEDSASVAPSTRDELAVTLGLLHVNSSSAFANATDPQQEPNGEV